MLQQFRNRANKANNGAIYSTSSPGLFSSDKRAHQVGDILTVQLRKLFLTKSVTSQSAKEDSVGAEAAPTGLLKNFVGMGGVSLSQTVLKDLVQHLSQIL